ncbi:MAG: YkvA family protein [Chloroflexi bacterium]|nr:YkvA family protein [Chloroflexota bacterium]
MSNNQNYRSPSGGWNLTSLFHDVTTAWRLLQDPRVPGLLKLFLPIAAMVYLISPLDLLPGPFDDVAVLFVALRLFLQLAPSDAVRSAQGDARATDPKPRQDDDNTIDTSWRVVDDK